MTSSSLFNASTWLFFKEFLAAHLNNQKIVKILQHLFLRCSLIKQHDALYLKFLLHKIADLFCHRIFSFVRYHLTISYAHFNTAKIFARSPDKKATIRHCFFRSADNRWAVLYSVEFFANSWKFKWQKIHWQNFLAI